MPSGLWTMGRRAAEGDFLGEVLEDSFLVEVFFGEEVLRGFRLEWEVGFLVFFGEVGVWVGLETASDELEGGVVIFDSADGRVPVGGGGRPSRGVLVGGREDERERSVREGFRVWERDLRSRWVSERLMVCFGNYFIG